MPVFLLALAVSEHISWINSALAFFILHFLVYPASNGYNSYFDKDEGSIGGLKKPPKTTKELYYISLFLDVAALLLALLISVEFMMMILVYGLISKAYSHPDIRLKKFAVIGWLAAGIFQGYFTFILSYIAINNLHVADTFLWSIQFPGILSSLLLLGSYPMTQIYQHDEDRSRGDKTISLKLGIIGTFHFTSAAFLVSSVGFLYYFFHYHSSIEAYVFLLFMTPILGYFTSWYLRVRANSQNADYESTMRLNLISSLMLNAYFIFLWFY
ncbi:UbiA family prenyltransferase [Ekhidna sp.]|uniref:UbiA family prenyltransferase n=1 Tax=Ekhidna sp. TaxID=2608089 RepID=UPI003CCBFD5F